MYQINMLKGRPLPNKQWPSILLAGIAFIVPIALAFIISIAYFNNRAAIVTQDVKLSDYEFQLREMEDAKKRVDNVVSEIHKKTSSLSDVEEVLGRHIQWSDILIAISENLPNTLVVNNIEVIKSSVKRVVERRYGDKKKISISIPARTLVISLHSESAEGDDTAVQKLQRSLIKAAAFQRCVKDVVVASREPDSIDGKDVVRYELNCILKIDNY